MGDADSVDLVEVYRDVMAALNIAALPQQAIDRGFYVPRSNFSTKELATQFLLEPQSTHFLVGGIGSGKTTELLNARAIIERGKGTKVIYIDVSDKHRLDDLEPGVLIAIVAVELASYLSIAKKKELKEPLKDIEKLASGQWVNSDDEGYFSDEVEYKLIPGILAPPGPSDYLVLRIRNKLVQLLLGLLEIASNFIIIFDSLDRIHDPQKLMEVIKEDIVALKQVGIGVLLIGPLSTLYGENRALLNYFDQYSFLPDVDPETDAQGRDFLFNVLRKRISKERISDELCLELVMLSGGILRDLLKLTKGAAQRAFMADAAQVELRHVRSAAEVEGRKLLFGLTQEAMTKLQALAQGKEFTLATKEDVLLLEHRRVIQYQESEGQTRYVLHPTLRPLLRADETKKALKK